MEKTLVFLVFEWINLNEMFSRVLIYSYGSGFKESIWVEKEAP
jgi:hypothetical protein